MRIGICGICGRMGVMIMKEALQRSRRPSIMTGRPCSAAMRAPSST